MNKQPEITEKTRQIFVEAFCVLYSQKPIEKITIQEIARKAGFNRSTFYQYFLDIDDLLTYVENDLLEYVYEKRGNIESNSDSFVSVLVGLYESKAIYFKALFGDYGSQRFLEKLKSESKLDVPEKNLPDEHKLKPYILEYRLASALSLYRLWLRRGGSKDLPLEEFLSLASTLYKYGISSI